MPVVIATQVELIRRIMVQAWVNRLLDSISKKEKKNSITKKG
jgi:hypothetical protein